MTGSLELRVLGELSVRLDGAPQALPRSRKTRALLAYLAVTGRPHRREPLSELLWDVTDDRRAALRWSLSKLRKTLGPEADQVLLATRERVEVRLGPEALDLARLRGLVRRGLETCAPEMLESLVAGWNGELLEGMLLPEFEAFEAWLEAERSEARGLHLQVRRWLVERLEHDPRRAFQHARAWAQAGGGAEARAALERLAARLGSTEPEAPSSTPETSPSIDDAPFPPLFGRDREIARLSRVVAATREQRRAHVVLIVGEPGIGKTRLLEELRHRERERFPAALEVAFLEVERGRTLGAFVDAVPSARGDDGRTSVDREQLSELISAELRRSAEARGLALLLLDDAHLADPSSCELIHFVVRTAARVPLLTVLTCRPGELEENPELVRTLTALRRRHPVEEIRLGPLDDEATRSLVRSSTEDRDVEALVRRSAGVPLMALELARAPSELIEVPRSLADVVVARLSTLSEATRALVRWAAVLEQGSLDMLTRCSAPDVGDPVEALEQAVRYQLLRIDPPVKGRGGFRIGHALVCRVIYESISPVRRAAMHRAVAESIGGDDPTAELASIVAHHAERAGRVDLAARALMRAAERSAAMGAVDEALALGERVLAMLVDLPPDDAVSLEIEALCLIGQLRRPATAEDWVARLTALGLQALARGRGDSAGQAFQYAGGLRWESGEQSDGYGIARQALRATVGASSVHRARGSSMVALCLVLMEKDLPEAHAMMHEAEALADRSDEPSELALARALLHLHAGRVDEARRDVSDARTSARSERHGLREAMALRLWMQLEVFAGRRTRAIELAHELAELATRIREGSEAPLAAAVVALLDPSLEVARAGLTAAMERLRIVDDKRTLAWVQTRFARRERLEGDLARAAQLASNGLVAARAIEAFSEAAIAAAEMMAVALAREDDEAYVEGERALVECEDLGTLSHEARLAIRASTSHAGSEQPFTEAAPWNS